MLAVPQVVSGVQGADKEGVVHAIVAEGTTEIGDGAFRGCSSLASVTIPDSVTAIENSAFEGCRSLASVTIPGSVTAIGDCAFYGCSSLASVSLPAATTLGDHAFPWTTTVVTRRG